MQINDGIRLKCIKYDVKVHADSKIAAYFLLAFHFTELPPSQIILHICIYLLCQ